MILARVIAYATVLVVAVVVVTAFVAIGPPSRARTEALDRQRVSDLGDTAAGLHEDYEDRQPLPAALLDPGHDPVTAKPYEYQRLSANRYQLCAVFELPTPSGRADMDVTRFWHHPAGPYCYRIDVRDRVESTL